MKRNNDSDNFRDWTTKKLKDEFVYLKDKEINNSDNFDHNDYRNLMVVICEMDERDITYHFGIIFD